jgi:hypothetical protein
MWILLSFAFLGIIIGAAINWGAPRAAHFYDTWQFRQDLVEKSGYVRDWIVMYADPKIFDKAAISEEEVAGYLKHLVPAEEDWLAMSEESKIEKAKEGILNDRQAYFSCIKTALESPNVEYFAFQEGTEKVITNIASYDGSNREAILLNLLSREAYLIGNGGL